MGSRPARSVSIVPGRAHGDIMSMELSWDVSRTAGPGGVRFHWDEDTGWSYATVRLLRDSALPRRPLTPLHRVFAVPEAVAETAESLVRSWRTPTGGYGAEWDQAREVRAARCDRGVPAVGLLAGDAGSLLFAVVLEGAAGDKPAPDHAWLPVKASSLFEVDYLAAELTEICVGWSRHWAVGWLWFLS